MLAQAAATSLDEEAPELEHVALKHDERALARGYAR